MGGGTRSLDRTQMTLLDRSSKWIGVLEKLPSSKRSNLGGAQSFWTRHPTDRTSRASRKRQRQWRLNVREDWTLLCKLPRTTHNNNSKSTTPTVSRGRQSTAGLIRSSTSQLIDL